MFLRKKIAVVVPAHNEAKLIDITIKQIPDFVDDIIVVDDASTDETANKLATIPSKYKMTYIKHKINQGVGGSIVSGYKKALELNADIIAVMAGDAQMDPHDLPSLLEPVAKGLSDYAKGDRLSCPGVIKKMPFGRYVGNHVLSQFTKLSSGYKHVRDSQCGYTAVSANTLKHLNLQELYQKYGFPNDMLAKLHVARARLVNITVQPIYGQENSEISLYTALLKVPLVILRSYIWRKKKEQLPANNFEITSYNRIDN